MKIRAVFLTVSALYLVFAASCGKKEEAGSDRARMLPPTVKIEQPEEKPAEQPVIERPEVRRPEEPAIATFEVIAPADNAPAQPKRARAAEPTEPAEPPEPQPTLTLVQIAGPKVITAGQSFSLTGDADGEGKAHGYAWTFKSGRDILEMKTEGPRVTTTLNKAGEWAVSCKILWKNKVISSMVININVNPAAE